MCLICYTVLSVLSSFSIILLRKGEPIVSGSCLLIGQGPICNSMLTSLCFKSCEDQSLLKTYNGGLYLLVCALMKNTCIRPVLLDILAAMHVIVICL